jgi:uncharacterized protein
MTAADLLPNDISSGALVKLALIALVSSVTRGFSGFGSALIFMPLASIVAPPRIVASLLLIIDFVASFQLFPNAWRFAERRNVGIMALGAFVGVPIGTWALTRLDPVITRWIIASLVLALLVLLVSGWRYHGKPHPILTTAVGCASGLCSGLAQTGGPPIATYWLGQPLPSAVTRANIVLFFAFSDAVSVASYLVSGLLTLDVVRLALIIGPIYYVGLFLGARMFGFASETIFRRVCYTLIAVAAVIGLPLLDRFTH